MSKFHASNWEELEETFSFSSSEDEQESVASDSGAANARVYDGGLLVLSYTFRHDNNSFPCTSSHICKRLCLSACLLPTFKITKRDAPSSKEHQSNPLFIHSIILAFFRSFINKAHSVIHKKMSNHKHS